MIPGVASGAAGIVSAGQAGIDSSSNLRLSKETDRWAKTRGSPNQPRPDRVAPVKCGGSLGETPRGSSFGALILQCRCKLLFCWAYERKTAGFDPPSGKRTRYFPYPPVVQRVPRSRFHAAVGGFPDRFSEFQRVMTFAVDVAEVGEQQDRSTGDIRERDEIEQNGAVEGDADAVGMGSSPRAAGAAGASQGRRGGQVGVPARLVRRAESGRTKNIEAGSPVRGSPDVRHAGSLAAVVPGRT